MAAVRHQPLSSKTEKSICQFVTFFQVVQNWSFGKKI